MQSSLKISKLTHQNVNLMHTTSKPKHKNKDRKIAIKPDEEFNSDVKIKLSYLIIAEH